MHENCMDSSSSTRRGNRIAHRDIRWTEWNRKGRPSIEFLEWRQTAPGSVSGRAHLRFHGSWPSLASKSTSECARKHGKINDMPDTGGRREGGRGRVAESGVSSSRGGGGGGDEGGGGGGNTNRSRIASLLFALPRPLPHPELHTCQSSRPSEATPCPLQLACFLPRRTFDGRILLHAASIADRTRILCYSVVQLSLYFSFERKFDLT